MTEAMWGGVLGLIAGLGFLLVLIRLRVINRPSLSGRVLPHVRDLPHLGRALPPPGARQVGIVHGVFGPWLGGAAQGIERTLGGAHALRRRLERANLDLTVHEFRIQQVVWGLCGFVLTAGLGALRSLRDPGSPVLILVVCLLAFVGGVLWRDNRLSVQVRDRERAILTEFPAIAELLALSVAAGESPVSALGRVVSRSAGEMSVDLAVVLADIRTGTPTGEAFDALARRTGLPLVARFAEGVAVAVERGTPLADVLHAQAGDVREAGRRALIESAARKEVAMMVPVVFLVLPTTVLFAFWPGLVGLNLSTP